MIFLCQLAIASCFEVKRVFFLIAKHSNVLCCFLCSVKKIFHLMGHSDVRLFDLICLIRLYQLTWLTNGQASKYFFPLAKTDQVRETFRPSCRGKLLTEESPFYTFEATLTGFHTVRRVILHLSYFHQQSKITVYNQIYGKNSERCTCIFK